MRGTVITLFDFMGEPRWIETEQSCINAGEHIKTQNCNRDDTNACVRMNLH